MPRPLRLIVYHTNGTVRAHHSLFIPLTTNPRTGKIIHAVGTPFTGYGLVFKRNYDLDTEDRRYSIIPLCEISDEYVLDTPGDGKLSEDVNPQDKLEVEAKKVDAPGVSKEPLKPFSVSERGFEEQERRADVILGRWVSGLVEKVF